MLTAIAIVRPSIVDCFGVATELDVGLKLGVDRRLGAMTDEEVAEKAAVDADVLIDGEKDGRDIDVALPGFDPIENKFLALTPEQQLPLYLLSLEPVMSQHINPPSAAHLLEQFHTAAPSRLKSLAPAPLYSSVSKRPS